MGRFLHAFFSPLGLRRAVPQVWDGFQTNIKMMVLAELLVLAFALLIAIVRGLPGRSTFPLRAIAIAYTDFFRGTPLILVAYVAALGLPSGFTIYDASDQLGTVKEILRRLYQSDDDRRYDAKAILFRISRAKVNTNYFLSYRCGYRRLWYCPDLPCTWRGHGELCSTGAAR